MRFFCLFSILVFLACGKERSEHVEYLIWQDKIQSISDLNSLFNPILYDNYLLSFDDNGGQITCFNKESGKILWNWNDANTDFGDNVDGFEHKSYVFTNTLVVGENNLTYGIDLSTGETLWHKKDDLSASKYISGLNDFFVFKEIIFNEKVWIMLGDVQTGETRSIFEFEREDNFNVSANLPLIFSWEGMDYVTFTKAKWGYTDENVYVNDQWLHLYNLTEDKLEWVSDTIPLEFNLSGTAGLRPVFHDGQIILGNDAIYSYNIEDGSLEWSKYYGNSFVLSSHLSADYGRIYGNNDSGYMVCLDVHTGEEYFNVTTGSSASRIVLSNNRVYINSLTGGGPNRMEIRNAFSGELMRMIPAPFRTSSNNRYFDDIITVDSETGYVYTADHEEILCFDPEL